MRILLITLVLSLPIAISLPIANVSADESLTTIFASNEEGTGVFFNLENESSFPINIRSFDTNLDCSDPNIDISVYRRNGTAEGFETSMNGWILIGSLTNFVCSPPNSPSPLVTSAFIIQPGQLMGIAIIIDTPNGLANIHRVTIGSGANQIYSNGNLRIITGSTMNMPFTLSPTEEPRVWNGTVYYEFASTVPTLSEWGLIALAGILGIIGFVIVMRRNKATA